MATRGKEDGDPAGNAVERSLEDFIARANTTPPQASATAPRRAPSTLVVLGPQAPLAEVTEIVSRVPASELAAPRRRWLAIVGFGLAFVAGAIAVLVATRVISGSPEPVAPSAPPPVVEAAPAPPPTPVVLPMPVPTPAPAPAPEAEPEAEAAAVAPEPRPQRVARKPPRAAPKRPAEPKQRAATGLVDPFAN